MSEIEITSKVHRENVLFLQNDNIRPITDPPIQESFLQLL